MPVHKSAHPAQQTYRPEDYAYSVMWSEADQAFIGRVAEFQSWAAHGASPVAALQEITAVVRYVLEDLAESGEESPPPLSKRPFSGRLHLRMPEDLHRTLAIEAAQQDISLNQWITLKLAR
jgi:predicted HicB family RNase H-like nuclease